MKTKATRQKLLLTLAICLAFIHMIASEIPLARSQQIGTPSPQYGSQPLYQADPVTATKITESTAGSSSSSQKPATTNTVNSSSSTTNSAAKPSATPSAPKKPVVVAPTKTPEQLYKEQLEEHVRQKQDFQKRNQQQKKHKGSGSPALNLTAFDTEFFDASPPEGLYSVDIGLSDLADFGHLQIFADMNSDKYTDMVTVVGAKNVQIHTYDSLTKMFVPWTTFAVDGCTAIRNIAVGRSTQTMRLFVTCSSGSATIVKLVDRAVVKDALGADEFVFGTLPYSLTIEADSQPFIADLNGDFLDDIMYTDTGATSQIMVALQLPSASVSEPPAFYTSNFENALVVNDPEEGCIQKSIENKRLTVPHSSALVDFDGDCMADLFVTVQDLQTGKKFYEIYLRREKSESVDIGKKVTVNNTKANASNETDYSTFQSTDILQGLGSFCLVSREEVPEQIHNLFNFADIDRDGMIDMFYVNMQADSTGINMVVHYNELKNADANKERTKITDVSDALLVINNVCSAPDLPIEQLKDIFLPPNEVAKTLDIKGVTNSNRIVRMNLFPKESGIASIKSVDNKHMPGRVSIGDISSDGYPDIMMTMRYENGNDQAQILLNSPCHKNICGEEAKDSKRRMFTLAQNAIEKFAYDEDDTLVNQVLEGRLDRLNITDSGDDYRLMGEEFSMLLNNITNVQYAVFFDLMENSSVDILLVVDKPQAQGEAGTSLTSIFNNIDLSNFYIKIRMITDEIVATQINSAAMRCVVTQLNDKKIVVQGGNTGQNAYHGLQIPFSFIGIGRSNNFIEEFSIAVFTHGKRTLRTWTPVIPKSVLFVITDMSENPDNWSLTLLLNPTSKIPLILVCDGVFLLVLGLVIIVFHLKEKAEDEVEKSSIQAFQYF